jgi:hypothetical protein
VPSLTHTPRNSVTRAGFAGSGGGGGTVRAGRGRAQESMYTDAHNKTDAFTKKVPDLLIFLLVK